MRERTRQSTSNEWEMNTSQTSQHNKQRNNNKEKEEHKAMQKHVGEKARVCGDKARGDVNRAAGGQQGHRLAPKESATGVPVKMRSWRQKDPAWGP